MSNVQTCSHNITTQVYPNMLQLNGDPQLTKKLVCQALDRIGTSCTSKLTECMSHEDAAVAHTMHMTEMTEYFNWLLQKNELDVTVEGCDDKRDPATTTTSTTGAPRQRTPPIVARDRDERRSESPAEVVQLSDPSSTTQRTTSKVKDSTTTSTTTNAGNHEVDDRGHYGRLDHRIGFDGNVYWDDSGERVVPSGYSNGGNDQQKADNNNEYLYPTRSNVDDNRPINSNDFIRNSRRHGVVVGRDETTTPVSSDGEALAAVGERSAATNIRSLATLCVIIAISRILNL